MSAPSAPLGVAVIGCGRIGRVHARVLAAGVTGARLIRVADADADAARSLGELLGVAHGPDADAALGDARVGAVVIATPPASHAPLIEAAAAAGRAILCEKPLAHALEPALAAVAAARRAGVPLQLGYHRRHDARYAALARAVADGDLGELRAYTSSMRDERVPPAAQLRGERLLLDAGTHDFDCARWLLGEIAELTSFGRRGDAPAFAGLDEHDHVVTVLHSRSGVLGTIETSRISGYGFDCRTELIGAAGALRIESVDAELPERRLPGRAERPLHRDFHDRFAAAYPLQLAAFVAHVRAGLPPLVSGEDGLAALRLGLAAERSLAAGGERIVLDDALRRQPRRGLQHSRA